MKKLVDKAQLDLLAKKKDDKYKEEITNAANGKPPQSDGKPAVLDRLDYDEKKEDAKKLETKTGASKKAEEKEKKDNDKKDEEDSDDDSDSDD